MKKLKTLKKIDYKLTAILLLFLVSIGQTIYFTRENKKLNSRLNDEFEKRQDLAQKYDTLYSATTQFYGEFQEVTGVTADGFTGTLERMDNFMEVHDENVKIYNDNFDGIWYRLDRIENYLGI